MSSKVWFVTGSSRGLGRAVVELALQRGDCVVATARRPERLDDLVDRYGDRVRPIALDVTDPLQAEDATRAAVAAFGRLDVVVNNAGYADVASIEDTSLEDFRRQIETDFFGVVHVTKAVIPVLRRQRAGHIFQISSLSARIGGVGLAAYQSAKWAVSGFSLGLADELAPFGVKVTVLEPSGIATDWAGSSMTIPPVSEPYKPVVGEFATLIRNTSGHEPVSVDRVARLIADIADISDHGEAPVRLLVGADAVHWARKAADQLAESDERWRQLSLSVLDPPSVTSADDLWTTVPRLLDAATYCVIATADQHGAPWATPIFFAAQGHRDLFWVSGRASRHSRNIESRPGIAVTVFDSTSPIGRAEALYLTAQAQVCDDPAAALDILNAALPPAQHLSRADLAPTGPLTAYRARISRYEVLIRGGNPSFGNVIDQRHEVHPPASGP